MTAINPHPNLGTQQSPISLEETVEAKDLGVSIGWEALTIKAECDGYVPSRKVSGTAKPKSGVLRLDGEKYVPIDIHWHFPSEHVVGSKRFDGEVHIVHVHKNDLAYAKKGKIDWCRIAVVGVFLQAGSKSYAPIEVAEASNDSEHTITRGKIIPRNRSAFRYEGSLTTSPYSENVTFIIFKQPQTATKKQLRPRGMPNARALQSSNRRYCIVGKVS